MRHPCYVISDGTDPVSSVIPSVELEKIGQHDLSSVSFWLVDMLDWHAGWEVLCHIRRHLAPSVYLRPIVCRVNSDDIPPDILHAADGHVGVDAIGEQALEAWAAKVEPINQWIDRLPEASAATDTNIAFKVLRFIASRNREFEPRATARCITGYIYPELEPLFIKHDASLMETLYFLQEQRLLANRFVSKAHFCNRCDSAFLNFKESCPQCGADDLMTDELVHHFKCAYTGEISEFRHADNLICPKCDKTLHHIGVDYDKPSIVYRCNQCNHVFQDPKIITTCYNCGRSAEPENQVMRAIHAYSITAVGENAADFGLETLFRNILETEIRLCSESTFRDFLRVEAARIKRYQRSTSSLVLIRLEGIDKLYIKLGRRAQEIFADVSNAFQTVLRQSDVISARNESLFLVIMTETGEAQSQLAVDRLQTRLSGLLEHNVDFKPEVAARVHEIDADLDLDATLEQFLQDHAD